MRRRVIELQKGRVIRDEAGGGYRTSTAELNAMLDA
jgi:hypothetical protein